MEIFSAQNYINASTLIAVFYAFYLCSLSTKKYLRGSSSFIFPAILSGIVILYIGLRPLWAYADTALYTLMYQMIQRGDWADATKTGAEPFFQFVENICVRHISASHWLLLIASFYIGGQCIAGYRWMPRHYMLFLMFLLIDFSFFGYATNGIRNGMAMGISILGLSFFKRDKKSLVIGFLLLGLGIATHKSTLLLLVAATCALFFKNTKIYLIVWGIFALISIPMQDSIATVLGNSFDDQRMHNYLHYDVSDELFNRTGLRWDFMLYSIAPMLLGYYAIYKKKVANDTYVFLFNVYVIANAAWVLINPVAYSNRFAYISWGLIPFILAYPLARLELFRSQPIVTAAILMTSTAFTYFMSSIRQLF